MNQQRFDVETDIRIFMLSGIIVMFSVCVAGFFILGIEAIMNNNLGGIILFSIPLPILSICYARLFISIIKEKFVSVIFNNSDKVLRLERKDRTYITIPYSDIKCIKVIIYDYIRFTKATNVQIHTVNCIYKITYPSKLDIQNILSNTSIKTEFKNTFFFFIT